MTGASIQTTVSKVDSNYFGRSIMRNNIPQFKLRDTSWGSTPAFAVPMRAGEKMVATLTAPTVIQAVSDEYNQETLMEPAILNTQSYCNGIQITQSSESSSTIVNKFPVSHMAHISKVSGGSIVTANIGTASNVQISADSRISVVIEAINDCAIVFRDIGDWISNITLSSLNNLRTWVAKFEVIIQEYHMLVNDSIRTFSLLVGAAASTYYTIMWLRYRAPQLMNMIMNMIGDITITTWSNIETNHGPYIQDEVRAMPIEG